MLIVGGEGGCGQSLPRSGLVGGRAVGSDASAEPVAARSRVVLRGP